jgi:hypothetical protein
MVKKDIITIFNVDSLLGYAIAFRFLESKRKHTTIRLVCHEKDGLEKLEDLGGKLIKTDYNDENKINEALDGTWLLLVVPEYSEKRFEYGNLVLSRAKDLNVNYVVLFS